MATAKKITLHPKDISGQVIEDINVYPKTTVDQVYNNDGSAPFDFNFQRPLSTNDELGLADNNLSINFSSEPFKAALLDMIYPVGALYVSTTKGASDKCPIELTLGGHWERIKDKFLLAAGDAYSAGESGGSSVKTLSVSNIPAHHHTQQGNFTVSNSTDSWYLTFRLMQDGNHVVAGQSGFSVTSGDSQNTLDWRSTTKNTEKLSHSHTHNHTVTLSGDTGDTGSGTAFDIMPPYLVVYVWKRTE